ncbi:hypothetical protein K438DRAFT_2020614 [Mycena galopus ATCC 62051]|nr:hypothetical protein K438DRAFT_2020614 [Mycena galopus ATCC 62051]
MAPCYYATHGLAPPNPNSRTITCPKPGCSRRLDQRTSYTGINRGRDYFKCYNSAHTDNIPAFWYHFPRAPLAIVSPPPGSALNPPASIALPVPPMPICKARSCQATRVHRLCDRGMCKKHCDLDGGCRVHLPPPPPPPQPLPVLTGPDLDILQAIRSDANAVPRAAHRLAQDALQNDRQHRAAVARIPSGTPSPPQLAPVKRHFVLVHWEHDNKPPTVYGIQNPSTWPLWSFTAATGPYQCYSVPYDCWMNVRANDVHTVTPGQPLLIRSLGITGLDEGAHIARAKSHAEYEFNSLVPQPPAKRKAIVLCESDDDDVVIVGSSKGVSGTPVRPSKRRRLPIRPRLQVNAESDSDSDVVVIDSPPPRRRLSISTPQRRLSISTRPQSLPCPP